MKDITTDPAGFAQALRDLAQDAHEAMNGSPSSALLWELARRGERLAYSLGDRRKSPLGAWLDNLGNELRTTAARLARASRHLSLHV